MGHNVSGRKENQGYYWPHIDILHNTIGPMSWCKCWHSQWPITTETGTYYNWLQQQWEDVPCVMLVEVRGWLLGTLDTSDQQLCPLADSIVAQSQLQFPFPIFKLDLLVKLKSDYQSLSYTKSVIS